jgi:alkanesulfonate monooxygenase SsuD/methylene tetrahydromethanopterin reductase-like flavin-dependent oxidoreductase (luciferase family)
MKFWYFTEQQYHPAWDRFAGPIRNVPPTSLIDPDEAADLMDRYYREFAAIDEMGLNIAVNEHHTSYQCMSPTPYLSMAALARTTKRARLLSIGTPIAQRSDPVRVAEEIALADILSRGRTEAGLIKSIPWEYFNSNANPMRITERFWEAHDLIVKALSTRSGPFAWNGRFFHYRNVNVVPRPYQDPHPPIWMTGQSPGSAASIAERGYVAATSQNGPGAAPFFKAYREAYERRFGEPPSTDRLAYICYIAVGKTESEAQERAQRVHKWVEFLPRQDSRFQHAAGYAPARDFARLLRAGKGGSLFFNYVPPSIVELREQGIMFFGTADQVTEQLIKFYRKVNGFGHLLMQMGGIATQEDTIESMQLIANVVRPRLEEFNRSESLDHAVAI